MIIKLRKIVIQELCLGCLSIIIVDYFFNKVLLTCFGENINAQTIIDEFSTSGKYSSTRILQSFAL